jgi:hypothetical protein
VYGYGPDLAHAHDRGFADLAEIAAQRMLALLRERGRIPAWWSSAAAAGGPRGD